MTPILSARSNARIVCGLIRCILNFTMSLKFDTVRRLVSRPGAVRELGTLAMKVDRLLRNNPREVSLEDAQQLYTQAWKII